MLPKSAARRAQGHAECGWLLMAYWVQELSVPPADGSLGDVRAVAPGNAGCMRQAAQTAEHWMHGSADWVLGWQVYRAVRLGVQDVAVKLLTNVDTAQLDVFIEVGSVLSHKARAFLALPCRAPGGAVTEPSGS